MDDPAREHPDRKEPGRERPSRQSPSRQSPSRQSPSRQSPSGEGPSRKIGLGAALRMAWVGYHMELDEELAAAGFGDRKFPDGRVLRMLVRTQGLTISDIGRELGMTRQGAAKIVASLRDSGYVSVTPSSKDAREKLVSSTDRGRAYLEAHRKAARAIERRVRRQLGAGSYEALQSLVDTLAADDQPRMRSYLTGLATTSRPPVSSR
jgi:DNA-binding MarR family transcriptional regulator